MTSIPFCSCPECGRIFYFKSELNFHCEQHEKLYNPSRREQVGIPTENGEN